MDRWIWAGGAVDSVNGGIDITFVLCGDTNIANYRWFRKQFYINCAWYTTGARVLCYIVNVVLDKPALRVSPVPYSYA